MHKALSALSCAFALVDAAKNFPHLRHLRRTEPYNGTFNSTTSILLASSLIPSIPTVSLIYTANSTSSQDTSTSESCLGSVTYFDTIPPTVYSTITETISTTVSASNVSVPPPETITPPVYCVATVVPLAASGPLVSLVTVSSSSLNSACPFGVCYPALTSTFQPAATIVVLTQASPKASLSPQGNGPQSSAAAPTGSAFTSTVLVTKKTTVPVVVPPSSNPPVFEIPSTTKNPPSTTKPAGNNAPVPGTTTPAPNAVPAATPAAPATTTIANVPVTVLPSSVVIGGQVVSIPSGASSKTTVQVNGETFTVQNSQIIAPGTTYAITPQRAEAGTATASAVTAGGLTFSVAASQAIISGTTYAIGRGAGSSTTIRIGSETLTIGSGGVILPSTTVAPIKVTPAPPAPETITVAGLVFTVGPSSAVFRGTTYTIGPGAKATSIVVNGQTISFGGGGIGMATTTIAPEPYYSVLTVGGMTVSVDSTEAIIRGTTYRIGKGASTEMTVIGGKTVSIGPSGIGLPTTTIPPEVAQGAGVAATHDWSILSALLAGLGALLL